MQEFMFLYSSAVESTRVKRVAVNWKLAVQYETER